MNRIREFRFSTRRTPARLGAPLVTIRFDGNARLLPRLVGPARVALTLPSFNGIGVKGPEKPNTLAARRAAFTRKRKRGGYEYSVY